MIRVVTVLFVTGILLFASQTLASENAIFWTNPGDTNIYVSKLDSTGAKIFKTLDGDTVPAGLAVDRQNGFLYWGSPAISTVSRAKLDGMGSIESFEFDTPPLAIALDVERNYMFWTPCIPGTIERADLDGGNVQTIHSELEPAVGNICVDVVHQSLLWTNITTGEIGSCNFDGSNPNVLFSDLDEPSGIAVDYVGQALYWTESGKIRRHTDALGVQDVLTGLSDQLPCLAIDQGARKMYWSTWSTSSESGEGVYRADLDGSHVELVVDSQAIFFALHVPEPSGIVLATTGLLGLLAYACRRRVKIR